MEYPTSASDSHIPLHRQLLSTPAHEQRSCPLLRAVPAEIRSYIFGQALMDYEEPAAAKRYVEDSCWARPSYSAPRRTDTALLRTCRSIYGETWFLPFMLKEQTHWITAQNRAPPDYNVDTSPDILRSTVAEIRQQHKQPTVEIDFLRIFTQMYKIEQDDVARFLQCVPDLSFRRLCITIRHADFWFWENDEPLRFEGEWIPKVCRALPCTVREVVIEMETVRRKAAQLDEIARQMTQRWHFRTKDGGLLFADSTPDSHEVSRWRGSSAWHNRRWVRDEISKGVIEYHVVAVRFKPKHAIERAGGTISGEALEAAAAEAFVKSSMLKLHIPNAEAMQCAQASVPYDTHDQDRDRRIGRRRRRRSARLRGE
ncbi:hypothetical protein LEL_04171 [Akanthomyces lecanii RCEF 1005]|uniref:Uncharacterized protein n=2 Tax=Akanthomyces TaxID=150366 RepID=A0A162KN18_CORDF|nr:hypothetical protein LEL_04171 [Akanthomyces lecanii RCEF 1005]